MDFSKMIGRRDTRPPSYHKPEPQGSLNGRSVEKRGRKRDLNATGPIPTLPPAKAAKKLNATVEFEPRLGNAAKARSVSAPHFKKVKATSQRELTPAMKRRLDRTGSDMPVVIPGGKRKKTELVIGGAVGREPWLAVPTISSEDDKKEPEDEVSKTFKTALFDLRKFAIEKDPKPSDLFRIVKPFMEAYSSTSMAMSEKNG